MRITPTTGRLPRNPGIDIVRGVSILLVVIHHMALRIPLTKTGLAGILPHRLLATLNWSGGNAVTMFFTISGFLIANHAITRWGSLGRIHLPAFYTKRFARIAPCLLVLIAVLSILDLLRVPNVAITRPDQSLPRAILAVLFMHLNWYEGRTWYLPGNWDVLWSLSIEEAFYLAFPLVCLALGRHSRLRTILFAVLSLSLPIALDSLATASDVWQEKAYWPGMAAIATGITAALVAAAVSTPRRTTTRALGWVGAIAVPLFLLQEPFLWHALGNPIELMLPLGTATLLFAFHHGWARILAHRALSCLRSSGRLSYEIYLTHMFVVFPIVWAFHQTGSHLAPAWLWFIPAIVLSWLLGRTVDRVLSSPAARWLRGRLRHGNGQGRSELMSANHQTRS